MPKPLVDKKLLAIICCPVCKGGLKLTDLRGKRKTKAQDKWDGKFTCKKCKTVYPIEDGIPILLPPNLR